MITINVEACDIEHLRCQLRGLSNLLTALDDGNEIEPPQEVGKKLSITRKYMDDVLWKYQEEVCDGEHASVQDLIRKHSGELTLYHAPIDTWAAIAADALSMLQWKEGGVI